MGRCLYFPNVFVAVFYNSLSLVFVYWWIQIYFGSLLTHHFSLYFVECSEYGKQLQLKLWKLIRCMLYDDPVYYTMSHL